MKHNPKLHERVAALPGHARLHPLQHPARAQGALQLMWELQRALGEIAGLPHVSLQPSAGSHGELAGVLLTRAYHADRGEPRTKVLTPDTAHGTNPATVTMAGYEVVKVGTDDRGGVDVEDLKAKAGEDVACLMLTNPNTLGLFDPAIEEIAQVVHDAGATLYYDGANLNAVMGRTRPGDMGFDIVHFNLHKTFTQPHGGGGPGAGPIAVSDRIEPYLPRPQVVRHESGNGAGPSFDLDFDRPRSIGRLRGFQGNFGVFVRSYAYILSLGADGLREASETAVLNANYLMARLAETAGEHLPPAYERTCMHEFVLTGGPMKKALGIRTLDLAKRLLDFGFHPPTVYFPLLVDEALLIEPTETETRETLDAFADTIGEILAEAAEDPGTARNAPYTHAGAAAGRGRRRQAPGHPPAALARNAARRSPSRLQRGVVRRVDRRERRHLDAPVRDPPGRAREAVDEDRRVRRRSAAGSRRRGSGCGRRGRGSRCRTRGDSGPGPACPGRAAAVPGTSSSSRPRSSRKRAQPRRAAARRSRGAGEPRPGAEVRRRRRAERGEVAAGRAASGPDPRPSGAPSHALGGRDPRPLPVAATGRAAGAAPSAAGSRRRSRGRAGRARASARRAPCRSPPSPRGSASASARARAASSSRSTPVHLAPELAQEGALARPARTAGGSAR